jgi:putative flippase GtrA
VPHPGLIQFARFVVVGLVNTAFSYLIYAGLVFLGVNYAVANLLALMVGILFSFKTQGTLVFANLGNRRLFRFVLTWAIIYAFNVFLISRFNRMGFDSYASGALSIPFATVLSYLAQKFFVFRPSSRLTTPTVER